MTHRDAPERTLDQLRFEAAYSAINQRRNMTVGLSRAANGTYHAQAAQDAWTLWQQAPVTVLWHFIAICAGAPPLVIPCGSEAEIDAAVRIAMMGEPGAECLDDAGDDMVAPIVTDLLCTERSNLEDGEFYLVPVKPHS